MTRDEIEAARKHIGACVTLIEGGFKLAHENVARLIEDGAAMARDCDAWRFVTGADTPEALAAELDAYRAIARPVRTTPDDPAPPHGANT